MAGTAILVIVPLIYLIIAMNTGDLLWASPVFNAEPQAIRVRCYGRETAIQPGTPEFAGVTGLVNEALSGRKRWDSLTLSDETYQEYLTNPAMMSVELNYPAPFRIHSPYKYYSSIDSIIIPLDGRHAATNAVFGRHGNLAAAGSFHVETTAPLVDYLADQGLCHKP